MSAAAFSNQMQDSLARPPKPRAHYAHPGAPPTLGTDARRSTPPPPSPRTLKVKKILATDAPLNPSPFKGSILILPSSSSWELLGRGQGLAYPFHNGVIRDAKYPTQKYHIPFSKAGSAREAQNSREFVIVFDGKRETPRPKTRGRISCETVWCAGIHSPRF